MKSRTMNRNTCQGACRRSRTSWTAWLGLSMALLMIPALTMAAPTGPAAEAAKAAMAAAEAVSSSYSSSPSRLERRAIQYKDDSEPDMELTVEANDSYYVENLKQGECVNKFSVPPANPGSTNAFKYNAITASEADMVVNFYTDDQCKEYEFSMVSQVSQFTGYFASIQYVGQFSEVKPGVYDKEEISKTVPPGKEPLPDTVKFDPSDNPTGGGGKDDAPLTSNDTPKVSNGTSPGFFVGVGIIGIITVSGVVAMGAFLYRKHGNRRSDGKFMTLSGDDDEGENGPHSSALMQSRVDASFDDERPQAGYRDENASDDEVELGGYPQKSEPQNERS